MGRKVMIASLLCVTSLIVGVFYFYANSSDVKRVVIVEDSKCLDGLEAADCNNTAESAPLEVSLNAESKPGQTVASPKPITAKGSLLTGQVPTKEVSMSRKQANKIIVPKSEAEIVTTSIQ